LVKLYAYAGKTLRVDLTSGSSRTVPLDPSAARQFLGGRGFNSCNMYRELPPGIDPLGPMNKVYLSTGPLVGTMFPTASRFNISAKSPQTGILGDSNAGGHLAAEMKYAGYDQVAIEGRSPKPVYIFVDDDQVSLRDASRLTGKDTYETDRLVKEDLGDDRVQTLVIGPAAENGVKYAGVYANLMRAAARTGLGTVLASKGVKAVAFRGTGSVEVAHYGRFMRIVDEIEGEVYGHPQYGPRRRMGTTRILMITNEAGFLPTRNYQAGVFEDAERVSGERLAEEFNVKTRGCFACTIPCSRFYVVREGGFAGLCGEGPEYEALGSFTSRIGNSDLGLALKANDMCNRLGLDALSTSSCIAFAMELHERGLLGGDEADGLDLSWGSPDAVLALIEKIAHRKGFGDILADGSRAAAEKLGRGHEYAMQVKGLDIIMADPRGLKGFGLGYAVASRGGDHLRSEPFLELSDDPSIGERMFGVPEATLRLADKGKGKLVSYFEDWNAVIDALEPCKNIMQNMEILTFERASEVIEAATGMKLSAQEVRLVGSRIVTVERAFNAREGLAREDDTLPPRFLGERLLEGPSSGTVFDLQGNLDDYYVERRWDPSTGNPTREALQRHGLEWVADDLERLGVLPAEDVKI
jgi:aldehyde:ferredoxin oxidoreductase